MKKNEILHRLVEKSAKEKLSFFLKLTIWMAAVLIVVFALFGSELFGVDSAFAGVFNSEEGGFELIGQWINKQIPIILKSIVYIIIALMVLKVVSFILGKLLLVSKKGITAVKLIQNFLKYLTAIVIIIMVLLIFGVNPTTLFASVGILGLVIGLSAQSLISDIISGLFIVFENEYQVGDYIIIDGFRGQVTSIGIRTTQLVDAGGNVKVVNNSEIKTIVNLSSSPSVAIVEVWVDYDDFLQADKIFKDHFFEVGTRLPKFIQPPEYIGPTEFIDSGITVKFVGKVDESYRFQGERDLRREVIAFMIQYQIEIPYPRLELVNPAEKK